MTILLRHATQKPPAGPLRLDISHPLAQGLQGCWLLNEYGSATVNDLCGRMPGSFEGTSPLWTSTASAGLQAPNNAGLSDVTVGAPAVLQVTANITLESLVYVSSTTGSGFFISFSDRGFAQAGYSLGVGSTTVDSAGNNLVALYENVRWVPSGVAIGTGLHHCALVINGSGFPALYIDGLSVYSDSSGAPGNVAWSTPGGTLAGYKSNNGPTYRNLLGAHLLKASVYTRALSANEIGELSAEPYGLVQTRPLQKWWSLFAPGGAPPPVTTPVSTLAMMGAG